MGRPSPAPSPVPAPTGGGGFPGLAGLVRRVAGSAPFPWGPYSPPAAPTVSAVPPAEPGSINYTEEGNIGRSGYLTQVEVWESDAVVKQGSQCQFSNTVAGGYYPWQGMTSRPIGIKLVALASPLPCGGYQKESLYVLLEGGGELLVAQLTSLGSSFQPRSYRLKWRTFDPSPIPVQQPGVRPSGPPPFSPPVPDPDPEPARVPLVPIVPPTSVPVPPPGADPVAVPADPAAPLPVPPAPDQGVPSGARPPEVVPGVPLPSIAPRRRPTVRPAPVRPGSMPRPLDRNGRPVAAPLPAPAQPKPGDSAPWPGAGVIERTAVAPRATLEGIAGEVGRIERKVDLMNGAGARSGMALDLDTVLGLLQTIADLLGAPISGATYELSSPCEVDEEGVELPPLEVAVRDRSTIGDATIERLDALAEIMRLMARMKTPTCKHKSPVGERVTVNFEEA